MCNACAPLDGPRKSSALTNGEELRCGGAPCTCTARCGGERSSIKNEARILPLAEGRKVALLGQMASTPRFQGTGSSHINPTKCISARDAMPNAPFAAGYLEDGSTTQELIAEAINQAKAAEVAIVFAGLPERYESEGFDRVDLKMPKGHLQLIEAVAQANPNTVVVLCCGGVVECPWADDVKGILYLGLSGQAGGEAVANLLYGRVNPCGKLAESWPLRYEDSPTAGCYRNLKNAQYREGIYVGYRYYDKAEIPLRWAFGYGLSYTSFAYRDLEVSEGNVSVIVKNTGDVAGAEIVQLYILPPEGGIYRPRKELKGFAKVFLNPGEEKSVAFQWMSVLFPSGIMAGKRLAVHTASQLEQAAGICCYPCCFKLKVKRLHHVPGKQGAGMICPKERHLWWSGRRCMARPLQGKVSNEANIPWIIQSWK